MAEYITDNMDDPGSKPNDIKVNNTDIKVNDWSNYAQNTYMNTHRKTQNEIRIADPTGVQPSAPDTNSLVQTSTNIFIYANGCIVGMIQSFNVSESRNITKAQAIGWEGVVQAIPNNTEGGSISVSRMALYNSNLFNALGLNKTGIPYNGYIGGRVHNPTLDKVVNDNDTEVFDSYEKESIYGSNPQNTSSNPCIEAFRTLKDQRVPFEIEVKTPTFVGTKSDGTADTQSYYTERYIDCWLSQYSKSYQVGNISVTETATIRYADVY